MALSDKILRVMDVEATESRLVFLLLSQSVFLGIFYGVFDTAANSLFLSVFSAQELPMAFTISGLAGILMTSAYSFLQPRIKFSLLAIINLFVIALIAFLMWFGFYLTSSKWHVFLVLTMMGPLNILAIIGFWGTAGRIFSLRQGKRLFGLIDAGIIVGIIVSSYAIPILLTLHYKTSDLLVISFVSVLVSLIFQFIITFQTDKLRYKTVKSSKTKLESGKNNVNNSKFVTLMSLFVALSMVSAFFISYSFLAVTKIKYPDLADLGKFLGVFIGTVMFITLIIKTFVYGKFIKAYGLRTSLLLSPILLVLLSIVAAVTGFFGGYTVSSSGFVFFFLLIALSRLFSISLKSSIEVPSFKLLYQTIDKSSRHNVQARVDGTINELSALFSGVLLFLLGLLSFVKFIHFTYVLIFILVIWIIVGYKLYRAYKANLNSSLESFKLVENANNIKLNNGVATKALLGHENVERVLYVMNMQEKLQPIVYERLIPYLLHHKLGGVRVYALTRCDNLHIYEALLTFKDVNDQNLLAMKQSLTSRLKSEISEGLSKENIAVLSRSKIVSERELAARIIGYSKDWQYTNHIKFLLRDLDTNVKIAAIKASAKLKNKELCPVITEFLNNYTYGKYASDALIEFGEEAIPILDHTFSKFEADPIMLMRLIRIIGQIGDEKACKCLINRINFHNIEVAYESAKMLMLLNYTVDESHFFIVHQTLYRLMEISAWNIAARCSLRESNAHELLQDAFTFELKFNFDHIFTLLSLIYDSNNISHIRQSIDNDNSDNTDYAIEMLELIVSDDIKPILFPLIDGSSDTEKIRLLQLYFPIDKTPLNDLLIDIINRDYSNLNKWTKACAFYNIQLSQTYTITNDIVAQLFNSDALLNEMAACVINKFSPEQLPEYFKRLDEKARYVIKQTIDKNENHAEQLLINKIIYLKQFNYFSSIPSNAIELLAAELRHCNYSKNDELESIDSDFQINIYFLISGSVFSQNSNQTKGEFSKGSIFGGVFSIGYPNNLPIFEAGSDVEVYKLDQLAFDRIIFDYPEIGNNLVLLSKTEI
jgi:AAA family ATP:ADP antiporter